MRSLKLMLLQDKLMIMDILLINVFVRIHGHLLYLMFNH